MPLAAAASVASKRSAIANPIAVGDTLRGAGPRAGAELSVWLAAASAAHGGISQDFSGRAVAIPDQLATTLWDSVCWHAAGWGEI
jgi:hypothetical protein